MSDEPTGDKFVFGNTMKSTVGRIYASGSFGKIQHECPGVESLFRPIMSFSCVPLPGTEEWLELLIFSDAIAAVRAMTKEELLAQEQDDLYYLSTWPELGGILDLIQKQLKPSNRLADALFRADTTELTRAAKAVTAEYSDTMHALVKAAKAEMLEEPPLAGDTTMGLNKEWIDWYMTVNKCATWVAIREGKARLRKAKLVPKRPKRTPNPK